MNTNNQIIHKSSKFWEADLLIVQCFEEIIATSNKFAPHEHQGDCLPIMFG